MVFNVADSSMNYFYVSILLCIFGIFYVKKYELNKIVENINIKKEKKNIENQKIVASDEAQKNIKMGKSTISSSMFTIKAILQAQNEDAAFSAFYNMLKKTIGASSFTVFMLDKENNLNVKFSYIHDNSLKPAMMLKKGDNNVIGYVAEHGEIVSTLGLERDRTLKALFNKLPIKTQVCAPIKEQNNNIGLVHIEEFKNGTYSKEELSIINTACFFLGLSIELLKVGYRF